MHASQSPGFVDLVDQAKRTKTPNERIAKLFFASRSSYLNLLSKGLSSTSSAACNDDVFRCCFDFVLFCGFSFTTSSANCICSFLLVDCCHHVLLTRLSSLSICYRVCLFFAQLFVRLSVWICTSRFKIVSSWFSSWSFDSQVNMHI